MGTPKSASRSSHTYGFGTSALITSKRVRNFKKGHEHVEKKRKKAQLSSLVRVSHFFTYACSCGNTDHKRLVFFYFHQDTNRKYEQPILNEMENECLLFCFCLFFWWHGGFPRTLFSSQNIPVCGLAMLKFLPGVNE